MSEYLIGVFVKSAPFLSVALIVFVIQLSLRKTIANWSSKTWVIVGVIWIALIQYDSVLFGKYSRMEYGDHGASFMGEIDYRSENTNTTYLHNLTGGVDRESYHSFGGEYLSLRLSLNKLMPLWLGIATVRLIIIIVAFVGVWLWARRIYSLPASTAFSASALFSVCFQFNSLVAYVWGIGLSAIPLLAYVAFTQRPSPKGLIRLALITVLIVSLASPYYYLPITIVSLVAIRFFHKPISSGYLWLSIVFVTLAWLTNYAGVIYATALTIDESARGVINPYSVNSFGEFIRALQDTSLQIFDLSFTQNRGSWPFIFLLIFSIVLSFKNRRARYVPIIIVTMLYGRELLYLLPFELIGLGKFKSYNIFLFRGAYAIALLFLLMQLGLLQHRRVSPTYVVDLQKYVINSVLICISVAMLVWVKYYSGRDMLFEGGLDQLNEIVNLKHKDFSIQQPLAKAFAVPYRLIPASLSAYGFIAMSDPGGGTFKPHRSHLFSTKSFRFRTHDSKYYSNRKIDISDYVSLSLLKRAGVNYVISMIPLVGEGLSLVSKPPDNQPPPRQSPNYMVDYLWIFRSAWILNKELYKYYFSPKYAYVYQIISANSLVYSPSDILYSDLNDDERFLEQIANTKNLQSLYIRDTKLIGKKNSVIKKGTINPASNGYVIDVNVESKGLLIVNLPYTKWWKAVALDQELLVEPGNFFQTVIDVPEGNYRIILEYMRPKLTDKIFPALFAWSQ